MTTVFVSVFGVVVEYEFYSTGVYLFSMLVSLLVKGLLRISGLACVVIGLLSINNAQSFFSINTRGDVMQAFSNGGDIALLGVGLMVAGSILAFMVVEGIWRLSSR